MKLKIAVVFFVVLILIAGSVFVIDSRFLRSSVLPDNFFYFTKQWLEKLSIVFTFGEFEKAEKAIEFSERRFDELRKFVEKGKDELIPAAVERYEKSLRQASRRIEAVKERGLDEKYLILRINDLSSRHGEMLSGFSEMVSVEMRSYINRAREFLEVVSERYSERQSVSELPEEEDEEESEQLPSFESEEAPLIPMPYY